MEDQLFYVGQKALINRRSEILVLKDPFIGLDLPGGKIQEGEDDLNKSLIREVKEETGLEITVGSPFSRLSFNLRSSHKNAGKKVYLVVFECRYLSGNVKLSNDHSEFYWLNKNNFNKVEDNSDIYSCLRKYFKDG